MEIFELIQVIAAIIAVGTFILVLVKKPLNPYFEYKRIRSLIGNSLKKWKASNYSVRELIKLDDILVINRFREKLKDLDDEELAYLLRCAVHNGSGGDWGYWLVRNSRNDKMLFPLVLTLNESDWRPRWRTAYILENTFGKHTLEFLSKLPYSIMSDDKCKSIQSVLDNMNIEGYLRTIVDNGGDEPDRRGYAKEIVNEITEFSNSIEKYRQDKQKQYLENLSKTSVTSRFPTELV